MPELWGDARHGIRLLLRNPGFTSVAVITLALGIGANCLVFSVVDSVLLKDFPYRQPDRLVFIWGERAGGGRYLSSFPNVLDWKSQNTVFEDMGASTLAAYDLAEGPYPERIKGMMASASLFTTLGMQAQLGRTFLQDEERSGSDHVVLLTDRLWRARFNGDPAVIGSTIRLNRNQAGIAKYTIIGVLPASMRAAFANHADIWSPVARDDDQGANRRRGEFTVVARLKAGITMAQAEFALRAAADGLAREYPNTNRGLSVVLTDFQAHLTGTDRRSLLTLMGSVAFVLLIACANLANMMLARATDREREMTVRAAIGAGRMRLFRQLLTESVVISLLGGAAGALLTYWSVELIKRIIPPGTVRAETIAIDIRVLAFTFGVSLIAGVIFGFVPAVRASSANLDFSGTLKGAGSSGTRRSGRLRNALVVAEVAISLVLLTGAALMINSFVRLLRVNPGFTPQDLLAVEMALPRLRYGNEADRLRAMDQLLSHVRLLPGVRYAGITDFRPLGNTMNTLIRKRSSPNVPLPVTSETIAGDYFAAMGTRVIRGRPFTVHDDATAPDVALINEAASRRYWPGEDPLGKEIVTGEGKRQKSRQIIGVVADVRRKNLDRPADSSIYVPQAQEPSYFFELVIRAHSGIPPASLGAAVRTEMAAIDRELATERVELMTDVVAQRLARPRFLTTLMAGFGLLALMLTVTGIYGVVAYLVRLRTREIGIRMALGAEPGNVLRLILTRGVKLGAAGIALGVAASLALTRTLTSLLYEVKPTDWMTISAVALGLGGIVLLANYVPARQATKIDPVIALRYE